jgi:hypothetical protein
MSKTIKLRTLRRYRLKQNPFQSGFFSIFGLSSYRVESIKTDGLQEDAMILSKDFNNVFSKQACIIDGEGE